MTGKKYQIFVSSTYTDLTEERAQIIEEILKMDCIPAGMEFFPGVDESQVDYIHRVIDESDYFVLILGAKYGSVDSNGISYTEQEYEYAVSKGLKIIALIYKDPNKAERGKTDQDEALFKKFMAFRDRVRTNRLVKFWENGKELVSCFLQSITKTKDLYPATGWVRGDIPANAETLQGIAALELENQRLQESLKRAGAKQIATDIKMEVRSATNPDVFSETEIECVSFVIDHQIQSVDMTLFEGWQPICSTNDVLRYYRSEALPWVAQVAKTCQLDIKITNPYPFPLNKIEWEDRLFDQNGREIAIPDLSEMFLYPPRPPYDRVPRISPEMFQKDEEISLNPKRSIILPDSLFYIPDQEQELIFQRSFFAEKIEDPIKKQVKVRFRIKKAVLDFNQFVRLVQGFEADNGLNRQQILDALKGIVCELGKEQDLCDTQK